MLRPFIIWHWQGFILLQLHSLTENLSILISWYVGGSCWGREHEQYKVKLYLERWKGWLMRLGGVDGCRRRSNWKGRLQHNKALILPHTSLLFFEAKSCKIQYALAESLRKPPTARRAARSEFLPCLEDSWERSGSTARTRCARKDLQTMAPSECRRFILIQSAGASWRLNAVKVWQHCCSKSLLVAGFPTWLVRLM